jgi:hypothetical protein
MSFGPSMGRFAGVGLVITLGTADIVSISRPNRDLFPNYNEFAPLKIQLNLTPQAVLLKLRNDLFQFFWNTHAVVLLL